MSGTNDKLKQEALRLGKQAKIAARLLAPLSSVMVTVTSSGTLLTTNVLLRLSMLSTRSRASEANSPSGFSVA